MPNTLGIVEFFSHTNAPATLGMESISQRSFAGRPIIEWIARRLSECQQVDRVIVLYDGAVLDPQLRSLLPIDLPLVEAVAGDPLSSYLRAIDQFPCQSIVRVGGHMPLIDPALIDQLIGSAQTGEPDYVGYVSRSSQPVLFAPLGLFAEWCHVDALQRADALATRTPDRDHPLRFICSRPDVFAVKLVPVPAPIERQNVPFAIHSAEDWHTIQEIIEALGPEALDWQRIAAMAETTGRPR